MFDIKQSFNPVDNAINDFLDETFSSFLTEQTSVRNDPEFIYEKGNIPVDIIEFIESSRFLNMKNIAYSKVKQTLYQIEHGNGGKGYREAFLELGKGSGKTIMEQIFLVYGIYQILCVRDPHKYLNHIPGQPIVFLHASISEKQAKSVGFAGALAMIENNPWFRDKFKPFTVEVRFPKNVIFYCGHSGASSWLGYPILRGCLDEVNFMKDTSNRSVAKDLYRALKGSLVTRFPDFYRLMLVSSPHMENAMLHKVIQQVKREGERIPIDLGCEHVKPIPKRR